MKSNTVRRLLQSVLPFLSLLCFSLSAEPALRGRIEREVVKGELKRAITLCDDAILEGRGNLSESYLEKAKIHILDQEIEKGIESFLLALDHAEVQEDHRPTQQELDAYQTCLELYLDHPGAAAAEASIEIHQSYLPLAALHPEYHHLNFILALAYANQQEFDLFFSRFYQSYLHQPDHFLAHKTKALLNHRLFQRAKTPTERNALRRQVFAHAWEALKRCQKDSTLYRLCVDFCEPVEKHRVVSCCLQHLVDSRVKVPRNDIFFYVEEGIQIGRRDLVIQVVESLEKFYPNSRTLIAARERLEL